MKTISIVIPTYKSEANLPTLVERLDAVLRETSYEYEIVIVNDASPDNTMSVLRRICEENSRVRVIALSRNFGQQIATTAGLQHVSGDAVIVMDDDLQDPPETIPPLLEQWEAGYDVVYAIRASRQEGPLKRMGYKLVYKVIGKMSQIHIPPDSGDFGLMDRKVVDVINNMPERNRFVRGLRAWAGYKQIGVEYARAARHEGKPSYNLPKIIKLFADGVLAFSNVPLQWASTMGLIVSALAFGGMILTFLQWVLTRIAPDNPIAIWPGFSTIVLSILFLGGVQLVGVGILGAYIARIYDEVKSRPQYLIEEKIGFDD